MSANLEVRESGIYGKGCYALARFPARRKIALYAGEIVRGPRRIERRLWEQDGDVKVIRLGDDLAIDGAVGGDATAYINHSCAPNAFMRIVPGEKVAFFALRDIEPGEEITINYRDPDHPPVCRCGAANCRSRPRGRKTSPRKRA
ncbi:MAG TPA: SET domain-containing protein-lysine N-methyltransferase [Pyrinomonadaceae bacterium]|nr:SET domain-containing protein-lysine N-methyltransferase [Pyrinomonadaceae bacterium]